MGTIRKLSAGMINKIAAGEVIERPASVVKELVENALDAGATRIEISVEKAGRERITLVDNGGGIASDELEMALSPHATSKIADTDDLFAIQSFGFRGEALASIAEISQLTLQSRPKEAVSGAMIRSDGSEREPVAPCGMAPGTSVEVRNLFFNTPVRRKYLKSDATEFGHISEAIVRLAIPNTDVHFILRHNGKTVYDLPPTEKIGERVGKIFGSEVGSRLISVDHHSEGVHIFGYVGHPDLSRSNAGTQYFFLNRRYIRDKSLQHALTQGYRGLMTVGRYPVAFLMIELAPDRVDVNVHPTKMEVRFLEPQRIYAGFLSAIREKFLQTDLRSRPALDESSENVEGIESPRFGAANDFSPQSGLDAESSERIRQATLEWAKRGGDANGTDTATPAEPSYRGGGNAGRGITPRFSGAVRPFKPFGSANRPFDSAEKPFGFAGSSRTDSERSFREGNLKKEGNLGDFSDALPPKTFDSVWSDAAFREGKAAESGSSGRTSGGRPVLQIHQKYLVFETESGMALIDQHALHERILYDKIKAQMSEGTLSVQRLLVPETVDLGPIEAACALENQAIFADFGLLIEPFGGNTILISGYPAIFERLAPTEIFLTLLEIVSQKGAQAERSDLLDSMMHQTACKAAIKGGDTLREEAMAELLRLADEQIHADHCPHGRPTVLLFSTTEIDALFKRT